MNRSLSEKHLDKSHQSANLDIPTTERISTPVDGIKYRNIIKRDSGYGTDCFPSPALTSSSPIFHFDDFETKDDCNLGTSFEKLTASPADDSLNESVLPEDEVSVREGIYLGSGNFSGNGLSMGLTGVGDGINNNENDVNDGIYNLVENTSSKSLPILIHRQLDTRITPIAYLCSGGQETHSKANYHKDMRGVVSTSNVQERLKDLLNDQSFSNSPGARASGNGLSRLENRPNQLHTESEAKHRDRCASLPDVQMFELQRMRQQNMGRELRRMSDEFYNSHMAQARRRLSVQSVQMRVDIDLYQGLFAKGGIPE